MSGEPRKDPAAIPLQQFGLKDSSYERPNQDWVCGHLRDGTPCSVGPDARGRCVAVAECRPAKKGDRWICTRRNIDGTPMPCSEGPLPDGGCACPVVRCAPVRFLRAKRKRFVFYAFALSIGILCFYLLGPDRWKFIEPGPLTNAHAQVLQAHHAGGCAACHAAGEVGLREWLNFAMASRVGAVQNGKCLACHSTELGKNASLAHSLPATTLAQITAAAHSGGQRSVQQVLAAFAPSTPQDPHGELACASCHQEHGGRHHDLTVLSDISCQVCHRDQFESFAHGHPEFKAIRQDRTGIVFDHSAHEARMPGGKLDCAQCHRPDPVRQTMQFRTYEQACAGCHEQGKLDHHGQQIRSDIHIVFQLPVMSLDKAGNWPGNTLAPASALTPMLQFLIAGDGDPASLKALKSLASDVVANGSTDDWEAEPETKAQLATAIKRVIAELSLADAPAPHSSNRELLRARIARSAGVPDGSPAVTELLEQLQGAGDLTKAWQEHGLPRLADDLAGKLKPAANSTDGESSAGGAAWKPPTNASGWFIDPNAVSVNFRPSHADALDKAWIDVLAAGASKTAPAKIVGSMPTPEFLAALRVKLLSQHGGSCIKCHAVQTGDDSFYVNWHAAGHATQVAGYAKFDHRPHLILFPGDEQCSRCHQLETASAAQPAQAASAPLFPSCPANHGLAPHNKMECAACHTSDRAPDACLTCHVYHMKR